MTFPEQIKGVPPELVEQGWRRAPNKEMEKAWTDGHLNARKGNHWQWYKAPSPYCFLLARPMQASIECWHTDDFVVNAYSHAGWGDGLAPTPEMCKVWKFWWVNGYPSHVNVLPDGSMQHSEPYRLGAKYADASTKYNGPVLPPVR